MGGQLRGPRLGDIFLERVAISLEETACAALKKENSNVKLLNHHRQHTFGRNARYYLPFMLVERRGNDVVLYYVVLSRDILPRDKSLGENQTVFGLKLLGLEWFLFL